MTTKTRFGAVITLLLLFSNVISAQLTTGTITGAVTDQSGAAIPGATITIKNVDTGIARTTATGPTGRYETPNLIAGNYDVTASVPGFQTSVRTGIGVGVGRTVVVNIALQVGEVTQAVTVTGEVSLIETTSATVSHLIDEKKVEDLPLNGRDLTQLSFLEPGVIKIPRTGDQTVFGGMGDTLSVAGSRGNQNVYLLDGVSNSDLSGNAQGASGSYIGAETVKEFQIITNNYSAEYRSQAGAIISAVTKSGTNNLHGSTFWTVRNDNFDASKWEDNAFTGTKPEFKRNQFGGSLGGPIVKDKTFFFGSYEGLRERLNTTDTARVPTLLMRQGILPNRTVTVNPAIRPYLDLWPVPGQGNAVTQDLGDGTVRIAAGKSQPTKDDYVAARINHQFASQRAGFLSGTYNFDDSNRSPFGILGDVSVDATHGGNGSVSRKHIVAASHNSIFSPSMLNEFKFGYSFTENAGDQALTKRDFKNISFNPARKLVGQIQVGDLTSIGFRVQAQVYQQKSFSFKDGLSFTSGNHSYRVGVDIDRYRYFQDSCSRGCNGIYTFRDYPSLLTATPRRFEAMVPGGESPPRNLRQLLFGAYFQDNWQMRPSFTLNLGLRYEFVTVPAEDNGLIANLVHFFDPYVSVPEPTKAKYPGYPYPGTINQFFKNPTLKSFSPRFGFAWAPGSRKTSFRGGFGIFYEHPMLYAIRTALQELPPFVVVGRFDATSSQPVSFPNAFTAQANLLRSTPNIRTLEYDQKKTYIYRWSATLQRELGGSWVVSAGYTGSRALHLMQQSLGNIRRWDGFPNNVPSGQKHWSPGAPLLQAAFGEMRMQAPNANSYFHGLGIGVQKRLSYGLQVQLAYNFQKAIDQGSGVTQGGDELPQGQRGIYYWDMDLKRGLAAFDIRNSAVLNFTYDLFPGRTFRGAAGALGGGWQLNGILTFSGGHPLSVLDNLNEAQNDRIGDNESLHADLIPNGNNNPVLGGPDKYYDARQFAPSRTGYFGNLAPGTVTSPGIATFDFSLLKNFAVAERKRIQFRAEFFNLFNRPNFGIPDMDPFVGTATREQWDAGGAARDRTYDANAGRIEKTLTNARQIQFGLKFIF